MSMADALTLQDNFVAALQAQVDSDISSNLPQKFNLLTLAANLSNVIRTTYQAADVS